MNAEKTQANDHALTAYAVEILPSFIGTMTAVKDYFNNPCAETLLAVRNNAPNIRSLYRVIDDYSKALADLKSKVDFCVVSTFQDSPEIREEFKIQAGAKSIKCDAQADSMRQLMERFKGAGFDPCALFEKCSAITAKKAAEAFGLSEQALLESAGDLFATHENKPTVKMI